MVRYRALSLGYLPPGVCPTSAPPVRYLCATSSSSSWGRVTGPRPGTQRIAARSASYDPVFRLPRANCGLPSSRGLPARGQGGPAIPVTPFFENLGISRARSLGCSLAQAVCLVLSKNDDSGRIQHLSLVLGASAEVPDGASGGELEWVRNPPARSWSNLLVAIPHERSESGCGRRVKVPSREEAPSRTEEGAPWADPILGSLLEGRAASGEKTAWAGPCPGN